MQQVELFRSIRSDNQIIGNILVFETPSCVQRGENPAIAALHEAIAGVDTEQRYPSPNFGYTPVALAENRKELVSLIK